MCLTNTLICTQGFQKKGSIILVQNIHLSNSQVINVIERKMFYLSLCFQPSECVNIVIHMLKNNEKINKCLKKKNMVIQG